MSEPIYDASGTEVKDLRVKRIRITVSWIGCCQEGMYAGVLHDDIENYDVSGLTRVEQIEYLTGERAGTVETWRPR